MNCDVFFVSYGESNQEKNWMRVKKFHPDALRLHGIKGIDVAHNTCNKLSRTEWFWTVDGDNYLTQPLVWNRDFPNDVDLVMFKTKDPITKKLSYLGGVKLWHKDKMINTDMSKGDYCLNATKEKEMNEQCFSISKYNSTPYEAWKTAFRHCVKLLSPIIKTRPLATNTKFYLDHWQQIKRKDNGKNNAVWCFQGYADAEKYVKLCEANLSLLNQINDYNWLEQYFKSQYGG